MKQIDTVTLSTPKTDSVHTQHNGDSLKQTPSHSVQSTLYQVTAYSNTEIPETLLRPHDSIFHPNIDTTDYILLCNDSVFAPYKDQPIHYRESMFASNKHKSDPIQPNTIYNQPSGDWIFATIILLLTFISIFLNNQKFKLKDIFQSLFDTRVLDRVFRESNIRSASLLPMVGIYMASLALIIIKIVNNSDAFITGLPNYLFYLIILLGLLLYIFLKNSLIRLLGNIFEDRAATMLYIASNNLFYFVGGLMSVPLMLLLFYFTAAENTILKTSIFFICTIFIVRLFRGIQLILTNSKTSKLYLFYYLCIFEIVPILVMAKILFY